MGTQEVIQAIRAMPAKGYRQVRGKYETYISVNSRTRSLGTYKTPEDAQNAIRDFRVRRFLDSIHSHGLSECDCALTNDRYAVFKSGEIFNLFGKEMIGCIDRCGYKEIIMNGKFHRVHRVVADTFVTNDDNKPCVNHIDGNKLNNHADNLEWVTHSENTKHAYETGLEKIKYGEDTANHKLTQEEVRLIRQIYKKRDKEYGAVALSKRFNVDRTTILDIIKFKTWRTVT